MRARTTFATLRVAFLLYAVSAGVAIPPAIAAPDALSDINAVRATTCGRQPSIAALKMNSALSRAAQRVAEGAAPKDAVVTAGYAAKRVASIHLQGYDAAHLRDGLARGSCEVLADPAFRDVGISWRGGHAWLLLAVERGVPGNAEAVLERVLRLVNDARSQRRACGSRTFDAAEPVALNAMLGRAALQHSQDMATHSFMEHQGHDGSTPAQRVTRAGYRWAFVGENVAAGAETAEEVMAGWLGSPGHCANIMGADFSEMGIAFAVNRKDKYGIYWTMSLAAPG